MIARAALVWMSVLGLALAAELDLDGDGWTQTTDCDDTDPAVNPGADESCNEIDDDCDDLIDDEETERFLIGSHLWWIDEDGDGFGGDTRKRTCEKPRGWTRTWGDCDDTDPAVGGHFVAYRDTDGDGYGSATGVGTGGDVCSLSDGYVLVAGDCDDADAAINPSMAESCNAIDDNCDGFIDESDPLLVGTTFYEDTDRDGYGDDLTTDSTGCEPPYQYVSMGGDCDVASVATHPDAPEICDGEDNDCDGAVDESVVNVEWYLDGDGDGYGVPTDTQRACRQPPGYARGRGDCDDADTAIAPNVDEVCGNGVDDDCDGGMDNCAMNADEVADFIVAPTVDGAGFGGALASADVDGNGIGDLVVLGDAPCCGGSGRGAAFLFRGPLSGTSTTDAADFTVTTPGSGLGAVALGDVDDDGQGDLLLGAPGPSFSGRAYLFHGPLTGQSDVAEADATFGSTSLHKMWVGESVSIIPDHTGDGVADLLVGSPGYRLQAGSVFVFSGALTGTRDLISDSAYAYENRENHDYTGESVAAFGDENGDGLTDILIGAWWLGHAYAVDGGETRGRHYLPDVAAAVIEGRRGGFGFDVAGGDLDGDGYSDAVISAPSAPTSAGGNSGAVYAFLGPLSGSYALTTAATRWEGYNVSWGGFGWSVASDGDVDGDGAIDVLIGDPHPYGGAEPSEVFLHLGVTTGVFEEDQLTSFSSSEQDRLGWDATFVPDWSGDGLPEIAAGAPAADDGGENGGKVSVFFSDSLFD